MKVAAVEKEKKKPNTVCFHSLRDIRITNPFILLFIFVAVSLNTSTQMAKIILEPVFSAALNNMENASSFYVLS